MKPLLSSLREKRRYIGIEIVAEKMIKEDSIRKALVEGVHNYIGDLGMAKAGVDVVELIKNKGILTTDRAAVDVVRASLALIDKIGEEKIIIKTITTSGMLNKARQKTYGG